MKNKIIAFVLTASLSTYSFADFNSVESALEKKDIVGSEKAYRALTTTEKQSLTGQILAGRTLLLKEDTEEAFEHFDALIEGHAQDVDVNYYLGVSAVIMAQKASIFSKLGYAKDFVKAMEKTVRLKPDHIDALNTLIGFHLAAPGIAGGDTEKALMFAKQLLTADEKQGIQQLANVYWETDKNSLAAQTIENGLVKYPEDSALYFTRATSYIKSEDWEKAREDLNSAIKYAKDDQAKSQALYQQGKVSAESNSALVLGIESLTQASAIADKDYKPWISYRLAQLYLNNHEYDKAKSQIALIDIGENDDLKTKVKKLKKKLKKAIKG